MPTKVGDTGGAHSPQRAPCRQTRIIIHSPRHHSRARLPHNWNLPAPALYHTRTGSSSPGRTQAPSRRTSSVNVHHLPYRDGSFAGISPHSRDPGTSRRDDPTATRALFRLS